MIYKKCYNEFISMLLRWDVQVLKCIIFDMDGTLIDSERAYYSIWEILLQREGFLLTPSFYQNVIGAPTNQIKPLFLEAFGPRLPFDQLFQAFMLARANYIEQANFGLQPGVISFLNLFQQANILCALATSSTKKEALPLLDKLGLKDYFSHFVFGDEVMHGKPAPEIFVKATEKIASIPTDFLVFEDSKNGILAANRAGIKVYQIANFLPFQGEIAKIPAHAFKDFNEAIQFCNGEPNLL